MAASGCRVGWKHSLRQSLRRILYSCVVWRAGVEGEEREAVQCAQTPGIGRWAKTRAGTATLWSAASHGKTRLSSARNSARAVDHKTRDDRGEQAGGPAQTIEKLQPICGSDPKSASMPTSTACCARCELSSGHEVILLRKRRLGQQLRRRILRGR